MAWVSKWKNVKVGKFILNLNIITPNWLSVDKAMIFFISVSLKAIIPLINIVRADLKSRVELKRGERDNMG